MTDVLHRAGCRYALKRELAAERALVDRCVPYVEWVGNNPPLEMDSADEAEAQALLADIQARRGGG